MQVSSFSNSRVRKAGALETSGREVSFSSRMSKVEIERQESPYDGYYQPPVNKKQSNNQKTNNKNNNRRKASLSSQSNTSLNNLSNDDDNNIDEIKVDSSRLTHSRVLSATPRNFLNQNEDKRKSNREFENNSKMNQVNNHNKDHFVDENNPFIVKPVLHNFQRKSTLTIEDDDIEEISDRFEKNKNRTAQTLPFSKTLAKNTIENGYDSNQEDEEEEEEEIPKNDFNLEYFKTITMSTLEFVDSISPKGTLIRCKIVVSKGLYTEYTLYLEDYNDRDYRLMSTKRKKASTNTYYWIYIYDVEKNSNGKKQKEIPIKFGKLFSNFTRSKYSLMGGFKDDEHDEDDDLKSQHSDAVDDDGSFRQPQTSKSIRHDQKERVYLDLEYNNKVIGRSKPKDMTVHLILHDDDDDKIKKISLKTKKPEYDEETKTYRLDFRNRAKLPSTHNIQIVDESNTDDVLLQLGKLESEQYTLDFSYPFNAFSAFGLAISCLSRN